MKKISYLIIAVGLAACGNQRAGNNSASADSSVAVKPDAPAVDLTVPALPADYIKLDLSRIGLSATAMVPGKADVQQSTLDDNEGKRNDYIIYAFDVPSGDSSIDSLGGIPAEIDIHTTAWTLQQHKDNIKNSSILHWNRFVKEEPDYFMYTTSPVNSMNQPIRAKDREVFQFVLLVRSKKDGKQYCIRSSDSFDLTAEQMLKLFAIAKSIEI